MILMDVLERTIYGSDLKDDYPYGADPLPGLIAALINYRAANDCSVCLKPLLTCRNVDIYAKF